MLRCIDKIQVVDLRTVTYNVPPQEVRSTCTPKEEIVPRMVHLLAEINIGESVD